MSSVRRAITAFVFVFVFSIFLFAINVVISSFIECMPVTILPTQMLCVWVGG